MTPVPPYRSIGWAITRLSRYIDVALAAVDLTSAQYRTLVQLAQGEEVARSLADKLAVSAPNITVLVDALIQRGAVRRTQSTEDRRRFSLALTTRGRSLLKAGEDAILAELENIASEFSDAAYSQLAMDSLNMWNAALDPYRVRVLAARDESVHRIRTGDDGSAPR